MFETIVRERRRREVQPIVETIDRCLAMIEGDKGDLADGTPEETEAYRKRYTDILDFCEIMNTLFNLIDKTGRSGLKPLATTLGKLAV